MFVLNYDLQFMLVYMYIFAKGKMLVLVDIGLQLYVRCLCTQRAIFTMET